MMNKRWLFILLTWGIVLLSATTVWASGFAIVEQSVSGLGNAFAGGAASAEDASTIFFNPAGMLLVKGQQVIGGAHVIMPKADVKVSTGFGGGNKDGGVTKIVPNLYYVNNPGNGWAFGLGINAPFGLATDYGKTWAGRYYAVESDVSTININPSAAYQINKNLSVGAGFNAQYIDVTLSQMVSANPALPDVFIENKADDWSYGYNLGALYQFNKSTRVGVAYRSKVKQELTGDAHTDVPAAIQGIPVALGVTISDLFQNQGVNGKIDLPAVVSLSLYHEFNDKLSLMADASWTEWSSFKELTFNFEGAGIGGVTTSTTDESWNNTWKLSLGASYKYSKKLKLRSGLAYDQTPIPDAEHRTPRIPGEDRTWASLGAGYQFTEQLSADFAYAHLFVSDGDMNLPGFVASSENSVDITSIQLSYNF